jgi:peptidoglycan/xylan/chitin deacetylase (PgdA/CDA1 family)
MNKLYYLSLLPAIYSLRWTWWKKDMPGLSVLCYHKIGYPPENSRLKELWIKPEKFDKQIKWLIKNGYKTLLFSDLLEIYKSKKPLSGNEVLITFDDGYENNYTYAYKILKENNAKANIFVVFNTIGKVNIWHNPEKEAWINMANEEMLMEMQESKIIEFGSHTMNHPKLENLPLEDAIYEINESKRQLEKLFKKEMIAFAYPYGSGAYNKDIRKAVLDSGYVFDFSFKQGKTNWPWDRENNTIDRLFIKNNDTLFDLKLNIKKGMDTIF